MKAADANDDGNVDLSDSVCSLMYLFGGGCMPSIQYGICGVDWTPDQLTCEVETACAR